MNRNNILDDKNIRSENIILDDNLLDCRLSDYVLLKKKFIQKLEESEKNEIKKWDWFTNSNLDKDDSIEAVEIVGRNNTTLIFTIKNLESKTKKVCITMGERSPKAENALELLRDSPMVSQPIGRVHTFAIPVRYNLNLLKVEKLPNNEKNILKLGIKEPILFQDKNKNLAMYGWNKDRGWHIYVLSKNEEINKLFEKYQKNIEYANGSAVLAPESSISGVIFDDLKNIHTINGMQSIIFIEQLPYCSSSIEKKAQEFNSIKYNDNNHYFFHNKSIDNNLTDQITSTLINICAQCLLFFKELENKGILYTDFKVGNLLIKDDDALVIADKKSFLLLNDIEIKQKKLYVEGDQSHIDHIKKSQLFIEAVTKNLLSRKMQNVLENQFVFDQDATSDDINEFKKLMFDFWQKEYCYLLGTVLYQTVAGVVHSDDLNNRQEPENSEAVLIDYNAHPYFQTKNGLIIKSFIDLLINKYSNENEIIYDEVIDNFMNMCNNLENINHINLIKATYQAVCKKLSSIIPIDDKDKKYNTLHKLIENEKISSHDKILLFIAISLQKRQFKQTTKSGEKILALIKNNFTLFSQVMPKGMLDNLTQDGLNKDIKGSYVIFSLNVGKCIEKYNLTNKLNDYLKDFIKMKEHTLSFKK